MAGARSEKDTVGYYYYGGGSKLQAVRLGKWKLRLTRKGTELYDLEAMARDGLRLANTGLLTFSHLMNGLLDPAKQMPKASKIRSLYTLRDLQYVNADHFLRVTQHLAHLRKLNVVRALNLVDHKPFLASLIGPDLFGGMWDELHKKEVERRKEKARAAGC